MIRHSYLRPADDFNQAIGWDRIEQGPAIEQVANSLSQHDLGRDLLEIGTGNATLAIALCQRHPSIRIMATDDYTSMLEVARYRLEMANLTHRVQLQLAQAHSLLFQDTYFDTIYCHHMLHQSPSPALVLTECLRVLRPGGLLFLRDWIRSETDADIAPLLTRIMPQASDDDETNLLTSLTPCLQAAFTPSEVAALLAQVGIDAPVEIHEHDWQVTFRATT